MQDFLLPPLPSYLARRALPLPRGAVPRYPRALARKPGALLPWERTLPATETPAVRTHRAWRRQPTPTTAVCRARPAGRRPRRGAGAGAVRPQRAARFAPLRRSRCPGQPRTQEAPSVGVAHLGARRPPGSGLEPAPSPSPARPQPAARSAAGAPRAATPLACSPCAPSHEPPLAPRCAPPSLYLRPLATFSVPRPAPPHWLPARPAPGGAQVWAWLGRSEWLGEPGSTHARSLRTTRKRVSARDPGAACGAGVWPHSRAHLLTRRPV